MLPKHRQLPSVRLKTNAALTCKQAIDTFWLASSPHLRRELLQQPVKLSNMLHAHHVAELQQGLVATCMAMTRASVVSGHLLVFFWNTSQIEHIVAPAKLPAVMMLLQLLLCC